MSESSYISFINMGRSISSLSNNELVETFKRVVQRDSVQNGVEVWVVYDTHKDIQLLENEFTRRLNYFTKGGS